MRKDKDILDLLKMVEESLEVAEDLLDSGHYDFSASRSFYTTEAILITNNLSFSKHKAVIAVFGKEFVKPGLIPQQLHHYIADAFRGTTR